MKCEWVLLLELLPLTWLKSAYSEISTIFGRNLQFIFDRYRCRQSPEFLIEDSSKYCTDVRLYRHG